MLFLTNADVEQVLTMEGCIRVLEDGQLEARRGELAARLRIDVMTSTRTPGKFYRWGTMEGTSKALQTHAIRMKSDVVSWPVIDGRVREDKFAGRPGLFCGLVFLFDTSTGEPLALMHEGYLQHLRVGANHAIGVKHLAKQNAHSVGMLGSGGMARSHLMAFCAVRPIDYVKVYSPTTANRLAYAAEMEQLLGVRVEPVENPGEAVRGTDILSTCTNSMEPVVFGDMLEPGMHLTSVNGTELAGDVAARIDFVIGGGQRRGTLFQGKIEGAGGGAALTYAAVNDTEVDEIRETSGTRYGEPPRRSSPMRVRQVSHEELAAGKPGRLNDAEISSSTGFGGDGAGGQGIAFVTVGRLVYDLARARGLGTELPTEMFLQDIRD